MHRYVHKSPFKQGRNYICNRKFSAKLCEKHLIKTHQEHGAHFRHQPHPVGEQQDHVRVLSEEAVERGKPRHMESIGTPIASP